jgi:hypothetical protein
VTGRASQFVVILAAGLLAASAASAATAPARLVARVTVDHPRVRTGSTVVGTVVVANTGGSPAYSVTVGLSSSPVALDSALRSAPLARLLPGHRFARRFGIRVLGPGRSRIVFAASSTNAGAVTAGVTIDGFGQPLTVAQQRQQPSPDGRPAVDFSPAPTSTPRYRNSTVLTIAAGLAALALLELGVVLHLRRNRRRAG